MCPHFFRPLFLSRPRVPKMGPQNRPLAQPWCAKCPGLTDPHLVAYPCAAAIAAANGQPIYWRSSWWIPAAAFVLSQRSLQLLQLQGAKTDERAWHALYVWSQVERLFMQVFVCRNGDSKRSNNPMLLISC